MYKNKQDILRKSLVSICECLCDDHSKIEVKSVGTSKYDKYTIRVAKGETGKVIGTKGLIVRSIKYIYESYLAKLNENHISVVILESNSSENSNFQHTDNSLKDYEDLIDEFLENFLSYSKRSTNFSSVYYYTSPITDFDFCELSRNMSYLCSCASKAKGINKIYEFKYAR